MSRTVCHSRSIRSNSTSTESSSGVNAVRVRAPSAVRSCGHPQPSTPTPTPRERDRLDKEWPDVDARTPTPGRADGAAPRTTSRRVRSAGPSLQPAGPASDRPHSSRPTRVSLVRRASGSPFARTSGGGASGGPNLGGAPGRAGGVRLAAIGRRAVRGGRLEPAS